MRKNCESEKKNLENERIDLKSERNFPWQSVIRRENKTKVNDKLSMQLNVKKKSFLKFSRNFHKFPPLSLTQK